MTIKWVGAAAFLLAGGCAALVDQKADARTQSALRTAPPEGQFVEVEGTRVHVVVEGSGPDVVLIHGASGNLRDFTFDLVGRLSQSYRVLAFDRPGLGYTGRTSPAYDRAFTSQAESPQEQAALLAAAARQLGAEAPIVVGHSYGGSVAMAWGVHEGAAAVVSLAGAVMPWPGELGAQYTVLGSGVGGALLPPIIASVAGENQITSALSGIFAPQSAPDGYLEHVGPDLSLRPKSLRANARQVNSLRPHLVTLSARYGDLQIPVAFLHGDADDTVPLQVHSGPASGMIPGATLTVLKGVGHMPQHADPQATVDTINQVARRAGLK